MFINFMAHSLTTASVAPATTVSAKSNTTSSHHVASLKFQRVSACREDDSKLVSDAKTIDRRNVTLSLTAAVVGLTIGINERNANAAARRPPPPPAEKKDPNVSGVQGKVLASKKRKEAMKEYVAKLREKGKPLNVPSESPSESERQ